MKQQLEEIKEALSKATPGPWGYQNMGGKNTPIVYDIKNEDIICTSADEYNGKLIGNAPQWLASLVSQVEEMQKALEKVAGGLYGREDMMKFASQTLQSLKGDKP